MATEAEASRDAKAKVIAAEGEKNASLFLKEASDMMGQSKGALQVTKNGDLRWKIPSPLTAFTLLANLCKSFSVEISSNVDTNCYRKELHHCISYPD